MKKGLFTTTLSILFYIANAGAFAVEFKPKCEWLIFIKEDNQKAPAIIIENKKQLRKLIESRFNSKNTYN